MRYTIRVFDFASGQLVDNLGDYFTESKAEYWAKRESMVNGTGVLVLVTNYDTGRSKAFRRGRVFDPSRLSDWLADETRQMTLF